MTDKLVNMPKGASIIAKKVPGRYGGGSVEPQIKKNSYLGPMHSTPQVIKGALSKQELNQFNDLNRTMDNIKNGDDFDTKLPMGRKGGCSLHETDIFKIAVRNMTE